MTHDSPPHLQPLATALDAIDAELAQLFPSLPEPTGDDIADGGPFGMHTMAFAQWLRFVFVPAARQRIADDDLPGSSAVGAQAVREFDGDRRTARLRSLLSESTG